MGLAQVIHGVAGLTANQMRVHQNDILTQLSGIAAEPIEDSGPCAFDGLVRVQIDRVFTYTRTTI